MNIQGGRSVASASPRVHPVGGALRQSEYRIADSRTAVNPCAGPKMLTISALAYCAWG